MEIAKAVGVAAGLPWNACGGCLQESQKVARRQRGWLVAVAVAVAVPVLVEVVQLHVKTGVA